MKDKITAARERLLQAQREVAAELRAALAPLSTRPGRRVKTVERPNGQGGVAILPVYETDEEGEPTDRVVMEDVDEPTTLGVKIERICAALEEGKCNPVRLLGQAERHAEHWASIHDLEV